ncbi:uncharacterized protein PV09_01447 [Verruconis gallopava]|uniref:Uncharacterized protein n=1 Tax=Verruconis gallopava TaxID=253628 RepID=A0A0D2ALZ9_9PEZI|nr:uncharacterized protein PV09_01447 [Verruconis gallopava]KIW07480.1 hypothetical protein PV09_01447 [Verruconis gallopava]
MELQAMSREGKEVNKMLSAEVWRIISSPYPVSLMALHGILLLDQDGEAFERFVVANPCKIKRLVSCILAVTAVRPIDADLLRELCRCEYFRDQLLQECPELLDALLAKSASGNEQASYTALCLQILSQQLPYSVALPASVESFFIEIVSRAIQDPNAKTLVAAYDLLTGACQKLAEILPYNEWMTFEDGLIQIVKGSKTIQDQSLSLLCLGILKILGTSSLKSDNGADSEAAEFFKGNKASKSVNLAVLQAAWVTKTAHMVVKANVLRSLSIALSIVEHVPSSVLDAWMRTIEGQASILRLKSRSQDTSLHIDIRLKLISLISKILRSQNVPTKLLPQIENLLDSHEFLSADSTVFKHAMEAVLSFCVIPISDSTYASSFHVEIDGICAPIILAATTAGSDLAACNDSRDCQITLLAARHSLAEELAALWLLSAARAPETSQIEARTMRSLQMLGVLRSVKGKAGFKCKDTTSFMKDKIRYFSNLQRVWQEQTPIKLAGTICDDLEKRCETAEKPFRETSTQVQALQYKLTDLEGRNDELKQRISDLTFRLQSKDAETTHVQEALQQENERLVERAHNLEIDLKNAKDTAEQQIQNLYAKSRKKELDLRICLSVMSSMLDEATSLAEKMQRINSLIETKLQETEIRLTRIMEEHEKLRMEMKDKSQELQDLRGSDESMRNDILILTRLREEAMTSLVRVQQDLDEAQKRAEQSCLDHATAIESLKSRFQQDALDLAEELGKMQEGFEAENHKLKEDDCHLASCLEIEKAMKKNLQVQIEQAKSDLRRQQKRVAQMEKTIAEQEDEIAELNAIRRAIAEAADEIQPSDTLFEFGSAENDSRPKRAKPHKQFRVPVSWQPRHSGAETPKCVKKRPRRIPLAEVSADRRNLWPVEKSATN